MKLSKKQQILLDFLVSKAANGALKLSNQEIAQCLAKTGSARFHDKSISNLLARIEKKGLITRDQGKNTRDRIIFIKIIKKDNSITGILALISCDQTFL